MPSLAPIFPEQNLQMLAETGLSIFNDVITEQAPRRRLPIIDLRAVCSEPEASGKPIDPSEAGGGDPITDEIIGYIVGAITFTRVEHEEGAPFIPNIGADSYTKGSLISTRFAAAGLGAIFAASQERAGAAARDTSSHARDTSSHARRRWRPKAP